MSSQCRSHTRAVKDWDAKKEKWERNIMQRDMTTSRTFFQFCSQFTCRRKRRRRRKGPKKIQSWEKKGMASVTITACESVNCLLLHVVVGISLSVSFSLTVGRGLKRRRGKNITLTRRPGEERERSEKSFYEFFLVLLFFNWISVSLSFEKTSPEMELGKRITG